MYADDKTVHDVDTSKPVIQNNTQMALNILESWCKNNRMVLNPAKTKVPLITSSQKRYRCQKPLSLKYNDIALEVTTGDKVLGIV